MGKKLAIRGHSTRGKEVIELLEMMGGVNPFSNNGEVIGNKETYCYYISKNTSNYISWDYIGPEEIDKYAIFTLEEFWEKYPFKVGDKVADYYGDLLTIKLMEWHDELKTIVYTFEESSGVLTAKDLLKNNAEFLVNREKGEEADKMLDSIILRDLHTNHLKNVLSELYEHIKTTPKEELEKEFKEIGEWSNVGPTVEEFMAFCESVNKKPKYPTTYEECCEILGIGSYFEPEIRNATAEECRRFTGLIRLKRCRDAYWKIAGKEMGLGKPWEPDWNNIKNVKYGITLHNDVITNVWVSIENIFLAFPTPEMRDVFYDNFKDLIEKCKELLQYDNYKS